MIIVSGTQFHVYLPWGPNSVLNVKALVGAFNQEKALVEAFSVIVKTGYGTDGALHSTTALGTMLVTMPLRSLISRYWLPFSHKCVTFIIAKCRRYVMA